jgi:very-short-patch-repair endonuclease
LPTIEDKLRPKFDAKYSVWKERLLDLSGRNRLLNFKPTRVSTVEITSPDVQALWAKLALEEKALRFPLYQGKVLLTESDDQEDEASQPGQIEYKVRPGDLETSKEPPDLEKSLYRLNQLARSSREERGINTLYLACGLLEWKPIDEAGAQRAPLFLIPVELSREDHLHPYVMRPLDDDIEINPTLIYMLRKDFEFAMPEFPLEPDADSLESYFVELDRSVKGMGWRVLRGSWLGQFQFKKLTMYKDLEEHQPEAGGYSRVAAVAGCGDFGDPPDVGGHETFDQLRPTEFFTVLDSDGSQLEAILRVRGGQDLIIQGPPGTGKSQTITNVIAQLVYEGKKVLFVSEKVAALSVVYRRLQEVGLAPFCLELHSDKANKREVLRNISGAAGEGRRVRPQGTRTSLEFDSLLNLRRELNDYAEALHRPVHYGKSAFLLHGEIARLHAVPDVAARIALPVEQLDPDHERALLRQARKLAQMSEMLLGYFGHPWFGCKDQSWSMERQTEIGGQLKYFLESLDALAALTNALGSVMSAASPTSIDRVPDFCRLVEAFANSPAPPVRWLTSDSLDELKDRATLLGTERRKHHDASTHLSDFYSKSLFACDLRRCRDHLQIPNIKQTVRNAQLSSIESNAGRLQVLLSECRSVVGLSRELAVELSSTTGQEAPNSVAGCQRLTQIAALVGRKPRPEESWFNWADLVNAMDLAREALEKADRLAKLRNDIGASLREEFLRLPLEAWQVDFRERYSGAFRFLKSSYRSAMKQMRSLALPGTRITFDDARRLIDLGAEAQAIEHWFEAQAPKNMNDLGKHYRGRDTDWQNAVNALTTVRDLLDLHDNQTLPAVLRQVLMDAGTTSVRVTDLGSRLSVALDEMNQAVESLTTDFELSQVIGPSNVEVTSLSGLESRLALLDGELVQFQDSVSEVRSHHRPGAIRTTDELACDLDLAVQIIEIEEQTAQMHADLERDFGTYFEGLETDWDRVIRGLEWASRFAQLVSELGLPDECLEAACTSSSVAQVAARTEELRDLQKRIDAGREFLVNLFEVSAVQPDGERLDSAPFSSLAAWIRIRIEHVGELSDWIQFQALRRESESIGLDDFVAKVLEMKVPAEVLEQALQKRIAILELDRVYSELPILQSFQWRDQEDLVRRFKTLDRDLMRAYAQRIRAAVASRQPNLTGPAIGQFGFLRRELTKQRRHAPLRKLFQECGNIILDVTPCLMMSPLSVATYLPKGSVEFDAVIFDEASQVPSEEAIGAILRGRQLVVAGDNKQLPPTRFFERALDDGTDDYTEEDELLPLESMLEDCAQSGMQSYPLEWHYRSKHESLIAFSNAEFYQNGLITFPAPVDASEGFGVRFVHVPQGVYDRGRSRTNREEARRVAKLIEEHLTLTPGKSLGVIALSTAQEDAIREEVESLIQERPDLEGYLKPAGREPFFIKPLENVQGDERDAIIISIGYGRAPDGTLSLNFGPINQQGGERRLNVAVTRARERLVVVSSIFAHDIDDSNIKNAGPKLLKRYLDFAREGRMPVQSGGTLEDPESDFELAVWEALTNQGLQVDRQVGCSRYRIDLGVRDPNRPGRYLLGVECDGASYHSSRVARDRDRLRQQVLESLGWRIHRVWSTDWVRDPDGCLKRILYRLEDSGSEVNDEPSDDDDDSTDDPIDPTEAADSGLAEDQQELTDDPYTKHVGSYSETPPSKRSRDDFYDGDDRDVREDVIKVVRHEGPIHEDLVLQRVARMYNLRRTGAQIEALVARQIAWNIHVKDASIRKVGSFLWPKDQVSVKARRPGPGVSIRPIEFVPPEEIEAAAALVVGLSGGVRLEELVPEVARVLGYQRTGTSIDSATRTVIEGLVKRRRLVYRGEFLIAVTGQPIAVASTNGHESEERLREGFPEQFWTFIKKADLELVDKRNHGGRLWIVADGDAGRPLQKWGFRFIPNGGRSTKNRAAWYLAASV